MAPKIIITGPPASGKGTQCELIKAAFGVIHLSTGDMLRVAAEAGMPIGLEAQRIMNEGKLVPDDLIIAITKERLGFADCQKRGWVLDGFPRTRAQADALRAAGIVPDACIYLNVPDAVILERKVGRRLDPTTGKIYHMKFSPPVDPDTIARLTQRTDDVPRNAVVQLEEFHKNNKSTLECYSDIIHRIEGRGNKKAIFESYKDFIEIKLSVTPTAAQISALLFKAKEVNALRPGNLCAKYLIPYLSSPEGMSLSSTDFATFYKCVRTGMDNEDSVIGCYAVTPTDYNKFSNFFEKVIRDYHGDKKGDKKHETSWDTSAIKDLDVRKLGFAEPLSMRVRVGRNLDQFNLVGAMDIEERIAFEKTMLVAFQTFIDSPAFGGTVFSLTPDFGEGEVNPNLISDAKYQELIDSHVMFQNMTADKYVESAGLGSDWPYGRGCYQSADGECIIWFGEEDQLSLICSKRGYLLNEVFDRLKHMLDTVEGIDGIEFAVSEDYGFITSCPSNLGTGMRASVHIKIPKLTVEGSDAKVKQICEPLGLVVCGSGGEHTPVGKDGLVDISPKARLFIKESEIIENLYIGLSNLKPYGLETTDKPLSASALIAKANAAAKLLTEAKAGKVYL